MDTQTMNGSSRSSDAAATPDATDRDGARIPDPKGSNRGVPGPANRLTIDSALLDRVNRALDRIRAGEMVILVDEEDRENEGDLVMAADLVTPETINFMARFGRGLVCLTMTEEHVERLELGSWDLGERLVHAREHHAHAIRVDELAAHLGGHEPQPLSRAASRSDGSGSPQRSISLISATVCSRSWTR